MIDEIKSSLNESSSLKLELAKDVSNIVSAVEIISNAFKNGNKLLIAGNGGSAADAYHIAAELVHRFKIDRRKAFPAISLTSDTSILTAIGNDWSFEEVFSRQVEALGKPGDVFLAISTSGNSKNIIKAVSQAKVSGLHSIGLLGNDGGKLKDLVDESIVVPHKDTARIQECHLCIYHIICEQVEKRLSL